MLVQYLKGAIADLQTLIEYTKFDIESIKVANHNEIFESNTKKEALIQEFETKKSLIDQEIRIIKNNQHTQELQDILSAEIIDLFGNMRDKLSELKKLNSDYARIVFAVLEFFTSLKDRIIPQENIGYGENKKASSQLKANILQVQV